MSTTICAQAQVEPSGANWFAPIFDSYAQSNEFAGTVLVVTKGKTVFERSYGSANLDWQMPDTPDTRFLLGSLTKQFTAALILLLEQDGRIKLTDSVTKYIGDAPPAWKPITIAKLLGQTSGIREFMDGPEAATWAASPRTHAEVLIYIERHPIQFPPGSRYSYSNSNYEILGVIIETITGRPYTDILTDRILKPLNMGDTGVATDEQVLMKRADGYRRSGSGLTRARLGSLSVAWSAGGMYSTTHDLSKWQYALYEGPLLSGKSRELMTTSGLGSYGLGIEINQIDGTPVYQHGGSLDGFNSFMSFIPSRHTSIVVLSNIEGTASAGMGAQLDDAVLGKPVTLLNQVKAVPIRPEQLFKFVATYQFSPTFSLAFTVSGDHLIASNPGDSSSVPLVYEGVRNGHPVFFAKEVFAELEFVPTAPAGVTRVILHQAGHDLVGTRK